MYIQDIPINIKNNINLHRLFNKTICSVSVNYLIYNTKKNTVLFYGSSRPRGKNYFKSSTHAEELAFKKIKSLKNKNQLEIYIWKWNKLGEYVPKYSCLICSKLAYKLNMDNIIYTFNNGKKISAIETNPKLPLCYIMK